MNNMIDELKKHITENKLHEKAIEHFWAAFESWKKEYPKEYLKKFKKVSLEDLDVFVQTIGLRASQWPECSYSHVTITIWIEHNKQYFGKYTVWFPLSDDVHGDDFLEI